MASRHLRTLAAAAALLAAAPACTDLGVQPKSTATSANIFNDPNSYRAFLAKLYAGLQATGQVGPYGNGDIKSITDEGFSGYTRLLWNLQQLPTDETVIAWGDAPLYELQTQTFATTNAFVSGMFARVYFQVGLANEFLRETTPAKLAERGQSGAQINADVETYRAEARFLRALAYYHGLDLFGGRIPLVNEDSPIGTTAPGPSTSQEIFGFIESELLAIKDGLPPSGPGGAYYGRATQAAADMLLAHLYLNAEVYTGEDRASDARLAAERVIAAPGYQLDPVYQNLFLADNHTSPEIIFSVPSDGVHQQSYGGMTTITHAALGGGLNPADFGVNYAWWGTRTRGEFMTIFNGATDDARYQVFYKNGQDSIVTDLTRFQDGYAVPKYRNVTKTGMAGSHQEYVDIDFPMFRLADAYLIYAEAFLRGGGGTQALALEYVNRLRERAYGDESGNITAGQLTLDFILDERGRELYWEAHRRPDLIRFDQLTGGARIWEWKGGVQPGKATDAYLNLYPIPASQLSANSKLTQNPGYP